MAESLRKKYAVGAGNGTMPRYLPDACGIGPGDEVITTPQLLPLWKLFPVAILFVDIDADTYNMDITRD